MFWAYRPNLVRPVNPRPGFATDLGLLTHPDPRRLARVPVFLDFPAAGIYGGIYGQNHKQSGLKHRAIIHPLSQVRGGHDEQPILADRGAVGAPAAVVSEVVGPGAWMTGAC